MKISKRTSWRAVTTATQRHQFKCFQRDGSNLHSIFSIVCLPYAESPFFRLQFCFLLSGLWLKDQFFWAGNSKGLSFTRPCLSHLDYAESKTRMHFLTVDNTPELQQKYDRFNVVLAVFPPRPLPFAALSM